MKIEDLKRSIESKSITNSPLILVYKNTGKIICNQYIDEICDILNKQKRYLDITENSDFYSGTLFNETSDCIYVINVDLFKSSEMIKDNHIICCHKADVDNLDCVVNIPELEDWQLEAYAEGVLPGVDRQKIKWLCSICSDKFRLIEEIDKIKIFTGKDQDLIVDLLINNNNYEDLTSFNIFNLTTAIQKKDVSNLFDILTEIASIDVNPIGLNNLLYNNFKDIAAIKLSPTALPQTLNIQPKKFNALKYYTNYFTKNQLVEILELLSDTDRKIKLGELSIDILIDYLITHILLF